MTTTFNNRGIIMEPEREALRLSAMIALCVGAYIIVLSMDNFQQQKLPGRIGDVQCTWWSATMQGCKTVDRSLSSVTQKPNRLLSNL